MDSIIIFSAKYLFLGVVVIWLFAWLRASRKNKLYMASTAIIAVVIAAALDKIADQLYYDPRPFVTEHVTPLIAHTADNGFPSEHTLFSMAIAAALYFYRPKLS